jgi:hypothetical protein
MANPDSLADSTQFSAAERVVLAALEVAAVGHLACGLLEEQVELEEDGQGPADRSYEHVVDFVRGARNLGYSSETV